MASIADVFLRLALETKQFELDAQKAGDRAGETIGSRMGKGIGLAMKAGLGIISAGAALATKGLVELDDITAQFTADTGASADEAQRARKAINEMAGRNLQPMREIGNALAKVHNDLGLTGDAAETTTEQFLKFATVTKRDAAEEVKSFDDILDAYGKTAADIPGIMDKLIVSHQKYGGAIAEDEAALAAMAPQLKAFNLGIDDGIALLDLFKSSGIDAAIAPRALATALKNLNGESLPDFIKRLGSIADDGQRAQEAMKVFGSRAGTQLANAIRPGRDSLDAFAISEAETTDATTKAADAIEGTFGNQAQLMLKGFTSKLIELGDQFGPVVTGLAGLASLGGTIGFDKLIKAFASAGSQAADAFVNAIQVGVGAAGTVIGNLIASFLDPSSGLGGNRFSMALKAAAAKAAGLWSATFAAATKLADTVIQLFAQLPFVPRLRSLILASAIEMGTLSGSTFGKAFTVAALLALPLAVAAIAEAIQKPLSDLAHTIHDALLPGFNFHPEELPWPLGPKESDWSDWFFNLLPKDIQQGAKDAFGVIPKAAADAVDQMPPVDVPVEIKPQVTLGPPLPPGYAQKEAAMLRDQFLAAGQLTVAAFLEPWSKLPLAQKLVGMGHDARLAAANITLGVAAGIRSGRSNIDSALDQLREDMKNRLSPKREVALRIGQLLGKDLTRGLQSTDPLVRKQAEGTRQLIEDELIELVKAGGKAGKDVMDRLERQIKDGTPRQRRAARRTKEIIDAALKDKTAPKNPGDKIGDLLAADLGNHGPLLGRIAYQLGRTIYRNLVAGVTGEAPTSGAGGSGGPKRHARGGPVSANEMVIVGERGPELFVPTSKGFIVPNATSLDRSPTQAAGGDTFNLYLPDARHTDPWAVLDRLPRYAKVAKASAAQVGWKPA